MSWLCESRNLAFSAEFRLTKLLLVLDSPTYTLSEIVFKRFFSLLKPISW